MRGLNTEEPGNMFMKISDKTPHMWYYQNNITCEEEFQ